MIASSSKKWISDTSSSIVESAAPYVRLERVGEVTGKGYFRDLVVRAGIDRGAKGRSSRLTVNQPATVGSSPGKLRPGGLETASGKEAAEKSFRRALHMSVLFRIQPMLRYLRLVGAARTPGAFVGDVGRVPRHFPPAECALDQ